MLLVLVGVACGDVATPPDLSVATSDLVFLAQTASAPAPGPTSFWVSNAHLTVQTLVHSDAFSTTYVELRFPPGTLSSLNGAALTTQDSVLVTAQPLAGQYGVAVAPAGLVFTLEATPTVTFFYARYGDPSVADSAPRYPSRSAYLAALGVWRQNAQGRWLVAKGSSAGGLDEVSSGLDTPGTYAVAARR